jgi:hypothetical protein
MQILYSYHCTLLAAAAARQVQVHIFQSKGRAITIIDDNKIHVVGGSRVTGFEVIHVVGTTTDVEVKIIIFRNDGGGFRIFHFGQKYLVGVYLV